MMKLTPWFDGRTTKPVRPGVYQSCCVGGLDGYRYWDGQAWGWLAMTVGDAMRTHHHTTPGLFLTGQWRGILK